MLWWLNHFLEFIINVQCSWHLLFYLYIRISFVYDEHPNNIVERIKKIQYCVFQSKCTIHYYYYYYQMLSFGIHCFLQFHFQSKSVYFIRYISNFMIILCIASNDAFHFHWLQFIRNFDICGLVISHSIKF